MSDNKFKYWEVNTTQIVKALNKTEALATASNKPRKRNRNVEVLATFVSGERIPATEARALMSETV